ncbi:MAG TPA: asparagine synthase (glutamine-hydrolyzing) [Flavisolibacter sp.]|nr:asparagine synthase (glutamine-hydrolyzing) [Flavisolibacter sp.]
MCGIAGVISGRNVQQVLPWLQAATRLLAHRGPEKEALWTNDNNAALGHRRLCIIDLSDNAAQPMQYLGRYTLVFNGEIYNYLEIKNALAKKGHRFQSHSDTEVVIAAYAEWGADCLQQFDGAFAFAIWDEQEQTLFGARDRFGEKPFFYHCTESFLFASEIKALWQLGVEKRVNDSMLYNFLTIGYTTNPSDSGETFYEGIRKLPAAHCFTYAAASNQLTIQPYWQLYSDENKTITEDEALDRFTQLFQSSLHKRLRSDVAIGTSLSGGLDSSAIVAFCHNESAAQYTHQCFTASFAGFEKDETAYAAQVAKQFGLTHFTTTITETEVPELMERILAVQDEPFSSASALAQYKVFELAKQHGVTVLLDGQGADEILGGYHKYYKWHWQELFRSNKREFAKEMEAARALGVKEDFSIKHKLAAWLPEFSASLLQSQRSRQAFRHPHLHRDFAFRNKRNLYYATPTHHTLNGALYYNTFVNGLEELLRLADRNSMAHSVEVRLPYLQHQLVEFLFTLPAHFKIRQGWTKWLLRKATDGKLPDSIAWRRDKVGFEPPQKRWMENSIVQEKIKAAREKLVGEGVLDKALLTQKIIPHAAHEAGGNDWRYWSAARLFNK